MISLRPLTRISRDKNRRWFNSEQTCLSRGAVDIDFSNSVRCILNTPSLSPRDLRLLHDPRLRFFIIEYRYIYVSSSDNSDQITNR
jgi:hypothetical protein